MIGIISASSEQAHGLGGQHVLSGLAACNSAQNHFPLEGGWLVHQGTYSADAKAAQQQYIDEVKSKN